MDRNYSNLDAVANEPIGHWSAPILLKLINMTYEKFLSITLQLQKQDRVIQDLYDKGVDLIELVDPYHGMISQLIGEIYGEQGLDWFSWFCYENDFGTGTLQAWDEDKNPICYSHESLWEHLEKNIRD